MPLFYRYGISFSVVDVESMERAGIVEPPTISHPPFYNYINSPID